MRKKYNTPHRRHVVKTRMTDEEYADFTGRLAAYEISQSEFIRQAIRKATIRPIVTVSPVNDGLLAALLRQSATSTPNPAALSAVGATFSKEDSDEDDE